MKRIWQVTIGIGALGVVALTGGYFIDHHRCRQINYEQAGYEMPATWLISAKQCLAAANSVKLRSYARKI
ncbi:MAG: hypothetical protein R3F54_26655 [Alphaproteobacteria bacterium]